MSYLPKDNVTPLIIVGRQRAGTRYIMHVLNQFRQVTVQGEIPPPVMRTVKRMFDEIQIFYGNSSRVGRNEEIASRRIELWNRKKASLMFSVWSGLSKDREKRPSRMCKYFGYKCPGHEIYFDFYNDFFQVKPFYIYCIRNFVDHYLSISSIWPRKKIESVADGYLNSIEMYHRMKGEMSERVLLSNLDDLKIGGTGYINENILRPLRLRLNPLVFAKLNTLSARNATEDMQGVRRRRRLNREEAAYVRAHPELRAEFLELCRHYEPE